MNDDQAPDQQPGPSAAHARKKRYRDSIVYEALHAATAANSKVLAPVVICSTLDFTEVHGEFPWPDAVIDACTGEELSVEYNGQPTPLRELHATTRMVPSPLLLLSEAITVDVQFKQSAGQLGMGMQNVLLTSAKSFWKLVHSEEKQLALIAEHRVRVILLPGLGTAPNAEDPKTFLRLGQMAQRMDAQCLPRLQEYGAINFKTVQFDLATRAGVTVVPYAVVKPASTAQDLKSACAHLTSELARTGAAAHAQPRCYVLKPAVGACGGGNVVVVELGGGGEDASQLERLLLHHSTEHPAVRDWILQPFFPRLPSCEYKVFVTPNTTDRSKSAPDKHTAIVYTPFHDDDSVVFCDAGQVYNEMFGPDNLCTAGGAVNTPPPAEKTGLACTWKNPALHRAIATFATKCRDAFAQRIDMQCLAASVCRADVICLFDAVAGDKNCVLTTAKPLLLLNEMDNLWSASLLLDMHNPKRDGLARRLPRGSAIPTGARTHVQREWVVGVRKLLVTHLLGEGVCEHIMLDSLK